MARPQHGSFIGRREELTRFLDNLALPVTDPQRRLLVSIHGEAGVGKTFLVHRLYRAAVRRGARCAYVGQDTYGVVEAMAAVAGELAQRGSSLAAFESRHRAYGQRRAGVRRPPAQELSRVFVSDLQQAASDAPIVLFFDAYDRTAPVLDAWLVELAGGGYGRLPPGLVLTVAGRRPLDRRRWAGHREEIEWMPLRPFSELEARRLLAQRGVRDEHTTAVILALSGRLPLLVATLGEAAPGDPGAAGDADTGVVDHLLRWEDDERMRQASLLAALPRHLDEEALGALLGEDDVRDVVGALRRRACVSCEGGRCRYHEVVREGMLRLLRARSLERWRRRQLLLAERQGALRQALALPDDRGWHDPAWRDHALEQTYHQLCADPQPALAGALRGLVRAYGTSRAVARQWAELIRQAGADAGHAELERWGTRLLRHARDEQNGWATLLTILIDEVELGGADLALALTERAACRRDASRFDAALADLERAVALQPQDFRTVAHRGEIQSLLGRHDEALRDLERAIGLDPGSAWAIARRGQVLGSMQRYGEAVSDFNRALELDPAGEWILASRGEAYRRMGLYEEALNDFDRAVRLDPGSAWAIAHRGQTRCQLERFEEAIADFDRALELDPAYMWAVAHRAEAFRRLGRYREALADFDRAVRLDPTYAGTLAGRGEIYRLMERHEEALADFDRAVEIDPTYVGALASRGETRSSLGRYDEALADLDRAVQLDPEYAWAIAQRGEIYRLLERHEEALADFDRAIELDPTDAWALAHRGRTYVSAQLHERARADLDRATALDPGYAWAFVCRGMAHRGMQRLEAARADLDRAVELDPDSDWGLFCRALVSMQEGRRNATEADLRAAIRIGERRLAQAPRDRAALLSVGTFYAALGQHQASRALYERALNGGARPAHVRDAIEDLRQLRGVMTDDVAEVDRLIALVEAQLPSPS